MLYNKIKDYLSARCDRHGQGNIYKKKKKEGKATVILVIKI